MTVLLAGRRERTPSVYRTPSECIRHVTSSLCRAFLRDTRGDQGLYTEPTAELGFQNFVATLMAKAIAVAKSEE
jgi:hypothetical protein